MRARGALAGGLASAVAAIACAVGLGGEGGRPSTVALGCGSGAPVPGGAAPAETDDPTIPIGFDAYRMWDRWPYLRIGARTYMSGTTDRSGGNEGADASHYLRVSASRAVALDVAGPGVLAFSRFNHWHGSPWHDVVDGQDTTIAETATANPGVSSPDSSFLPPVPFPPPLATTWSTTAGADLIGVPMPFTRSLEIDYERTHYGTGYFVYARYPEGARNLSLPLATWQPAAPPQDVVDLVGRAGQDIAPAGPDVTAAAGTVRLPATGAVTVFEGTGPASIRALSLGIAAADAPALAAATLRVTWDDRAAPSIEAPVALFFGTGTLYNRANREYLVKAFPVSVRFAGGSITLSTYFPMPFFRRARVELVGGGAAAQVEWNVRVAPYRDPPNWAGYLHATYVDQGTPTAGVDLTLLDTTAVEGGGDWCGQLVGTSFVFSDRGNLSTLEGDPRFFFDDSQTPQAHGTGTEEWGGGGDYWQLGETTTLPFYGHPVGVPLGVTPTNADDAIESAYRFLLADLMPFGRNARIQLEHGGADDSTEHYRTVAYWYGLPGACLVPADALHVGNPADEAAHRYASPTASAVDTVSSRYDWGVDHVGDTVVYPETQDTGRHMTATTEFSLAVPRENFGVLLRRKLDLAYPDQRAEVFVADDAPGAAFARAGTWYTAGSSSCVYSNPVDELGPIDPTIEVSNRRWRDDEFLIPRALTDGRAAIRVRIVFAPSSGVVAPGAPALPTAWSEFRYAAYAWALPPRP